MADPAPQPVPDAAPEEAPVVNPVIVRDAQGQDFTIDASELGAFVRSGQYEVSPSQPMAEGWVPIRGIDGVERRATPQEAQQLVAGFEAEGASMGAVERREEEQRYSGALQGARALSAGALSTLPGAIPLLTAIQPGLAQDLEGLQRYRPGLYTAGEIGAIGGALLATGGGAAAAGLRGLGAGTRAIAGAGELAAQGATRAATAVGLAEGGLAARALGAGARGAVEVGLFEANREINQAAIQQRELEASKVAAAFGHGALLGGALMGIGTAAWGGAGAAVSAGREALAARTVADATKLGEAQGVGFVQGIARRLEEEMAAKSVGAPKKQFREFTGESFARTGAKDRAVELAQQVAGKNTAEKAALIGQELQRSGARVGELVDTLAASGVKAEVAPVVQGIEAKIAEFGGRSGPQFREAARELRSWADDFAKNVKDGEPGALWKFKKDLGDSTVWKADKAAFDSAAERAKRDLYRQVDDLLMRTGESTGDAAFAQAWREANRNYQAARWVDSALSDKLAQASNRTFGLSEQIGAASGLVAGGGFTPAGVALAAGSAALQRIGKSLGPDAVTLALKSLREGNAGALSGLVDRAAATSVGRYLAAGARRVAGAVRGEESGRAARTVAPYATNRALESDLGRRLFGEAAPRASTERREALAQRLASRPTTRSEGASEAQVRRAVTVLQEGAARQRAALEQVAASNPALAPEVRGQIAASERARDYLLSKIPETLNTRATLTPQAETPRMTKAQRDEFLTAARVVANPLSVLDSLQSGTLSRTEVEALKATAPELYASIQTSVQAQLEARAEPLPYRQALELSTLLGVVGHPSLDRRFVQAVQASYALPAAPPAPAAGAPVALQRTLSTARDWSLKPEVT